MAKKNSNPLFEYVVKPGQQKRDMGVPQWMHAHQQPDPAQTYIPPGQKQQPQQQAQPNTGAPQSDPQYQPQPPTKAFVPVDAQRQNQAEPQPKRQPASQPAPQVAPQQHQQPAQQPAPDHDEANASSWFTTPLVMRIPRGTAAIFAMSGVGLLVAAFLLGKMQQRHATEVVMTDYETQAHALANVAKDPVNPNLIPQHVYTQPTHQQPATTGPTNTPGPAVNTQAGDAGATAATGQQSQPAPALADGFEPREPGFNYFRLQVMPLAGREEGLAAVQFLRSNGIDAVLIPINNGGSLKLMALQGFAKPNSDPAARAYRDRIRTRGRLWKAKHDGSTDWSDLFAEKYIPGRT